MKQIKIPYEDKEYTLEFNRKSVEQCEKLGFVLKDLETKPGSQIRLLFRGAFLAHHKYIKDDALNDIFNNLANKDEIIAALVEMYQDTLLTMISNTEANQGNIKWEKNW